MTKYAIWSLNQASGYLSNHFDDLKAALTVQPNVEIIQGNIKPFHSPDTPNSPAHQLMFESDNSFEEYFIPIQVKCIGDPAQSQELCGTTGNRVLFGKITNNASNRSFPSDWQQYWTGIPVNGVGYPRLKMRTLNHKGYYQILHEFSKANDNCKHILIGYSQGGLVTRYLAYLDREVFKQNIIHAVIPIASPNYGSPVANPENKQFIETALFRVFAQLFSFPRETFAILNSQRASIPFLIKIFESLIQDIEKHPTLNQNYQDLKNVCITGRKWLSGLYRTSDIPGVGEIMTAFHDLSSDNYFNPLSVLYSVDQHIQSTNYAVYIASIINVDNRFSQFLDDLLKNGLANVALAQLKMFDGNSVYDNILINEEYNQVFANDVSTQGDFPPSTYWVNYANTYRSGLGGQIPKNCHDFIIPSINQVSVNQAISAREYELGDVYSQTNHISGSDPDKINENIQDILTRLAPKL
jgi:hypothetical protein